MHITEDGKFNKAAPFFSVSILCWNSDPYIHDCLQSLNNQTYKDFEILIVDNGSKDPVSPDEWADFPDLTIRHFVLEKNVGFAAGNNFAASHARGEYLALLNSDAFPQPDWLAVIYQAITDHPGCAFASKLIMARTPDVLDGEGDTYHATGLVWRTSFGRSAAKAATAEKEVFSACGAAAVYPKHMFESVGGFDSDYFAYTEDVDLGFRLRLAGIPCWYLPKAIVYHVGSGSTSLRSDLSIFYGERNLVWTFFKDMPGVLFWLLLPFHLLTNLVMALFSILRKQGRVTFRAKWDAFTNLGAVIRKRKVIQRQRKTSILAILKIIDWNPISPLKKLLRI